LVFDADIESSIQDCPDSLAAYLEAQLSESLLLDAVVCRAAHERALRGAPIADLNQCLSALRLARESRDASLAMGRRFASLAASIEPSAELLALAGTQELHHCVAFGYTLGHLAIDADQTVAAFLHQSVLNSVSAAQRLLPLGQLQANRIAWHLKPAILEAVARTRTLTVSTVNCFTPLPDIASMRHSSLPTRLFIS